MARIFAPNERYEGTSAGIQFTKGVGETTDPYLISWFRAKGYRVAEEKVLEEEVPEKIKAPEVIPIFEESQEDTENGEADEERIQAVDPVPEEPKKRTRRKTK